MSYGIVVCSKCRREVHQDGPKEMQNGWRHCEDKTHMCVEADAVYPPSEESIKGKWCGKDRGPMTYQAGWNANVKTGRNDPCPCGSGKKYKKCCGK